MIYRQELTLAQCFSSARYIPDHDGQVYDWSAEQVERLVHDLVSNFSRNYKPHHEINDCGGYAGCQIGSISLRPVLNDRSFLDGHQLFITLALLLISIHNRQGSRPDRVKLETLISYEDVGEWTINPNFELYGSIMYDLFQGITMDPRQVPANVRNLVACYLDVDAILRDGIDDRALPFFAAWLTCRVYLEVITAKCVTGASILKRAHAYDRMLGEQ